MASIEERKDGGIAVKWRLGGRRTGAPQTLTLRPPPGRPVDATMKLAQAARQLAESRGHAITRDEVRKAILGEPGDRPSGIPTFSEWMKTYLEMRRKSTDTQPDTIDRYEQIMSVRAVPRLGHMYLTDITPEVLRDWVAWMVASGRRRDGGPLAAETIRRAHAIVHGCLGSAVPRWLASNPAARPVGARKHIVGLPKTGTFEGIFLEPWEMEVIQAHCSDTVNDLVHVAVRTGLRLGEQLVLRVQDVVLDGKRPRVCVRRALKDDGTIGAPKSAKSARDVTVSPEVAEKLSTRMAGRRRTDLIFPAPRGGVWHENNLRRRHWQPAVAASQRCVEHPPPEPDKPARGPRRKLRIDEVSTCMCPGRLKRTPRWHDLRHTHASLLVEAGWSPKRVQLRMGHATYQITMDIYGHLWEGDDSDRLDDVERLLLLADDEKG